MALKLIPGILLRALGQELALLIVVNIKHW